MSNLRRGGWRFTRRLCQITEREEGVEQNITPVKVKYYEIIIFRWEGGWNKRLHWSTRGGRGVKKTLKMNYKIVENAIIGFTCFQGLCL